MMQKTQSLVISCSLEMQQQILVFFLSHNQHHIFHWQSSLQCQSPHKVSKLLKPSAFHNLLHLFHNPIQGLSPRPWVRPCFRSLSRHPIRSPSQHLGFLNKTNDGNPNNHAFGVEFDVFQNEEFGDINDNHVGVNVNSLTSLASYKAGYWLGEGSNDTNLSFKEIKLNSGDNYQAWIEYWNYELRITLAPENVKKPEQLLIRAPLDLSEVFLDEMYVGFTASTGQLTEDHKILSWSFNN